MSQGFGRSNFPDMALIDFVFKEGSKHGFGRSQTGLKIADLFRDSNAEAKNYSSQTVYRRLHYHIRPNIAQYDVPEAVRKFFFYQKYQTGSDSTTDESDSENEEKPNISGTVGDVAGSSRSTIGTPARGIDHAGCGNGPEGRRGPTEETPTSVKDEYPSPDFEDDHNSIRSNSFVSVNSDKSGHTEDRASPEYSFSASEASSSASPKEKDDESDSEEAEEEGVNVQSTKSASSACSEDGRRKDSAGPSYNTPMGKGTGSLVQGKAESDDDDVVILWANISAEKSCSTAASSAKRPHEEEVRVKVEKPEEDTVEYEEVQVIHEYARRAGISAEEALYVSAKKSKVFDKIMAGWKVKSEPTD